VGRSLTRSLITPELKPKDKLKPKDMHYSLVTMTKPKDTKPKDMHYSLVTMT
jgi:hypothetical protein